MSRLRRRVAVALRSVMLLLLVAVGCSGEPAGGADEQGESPCDQPCHCTSSSWPVWYRSVVRLDLLLVVDNSASMKQELDELRRSFSAQILALLDPVRREGGECCGSFRRCGARPLDDVNVAVITTDLGSGGEPWPTCAGGAFGSEAGDDGRFVRARPGAGSAESAAPDGVASRPHPFAGAEETDRFEDAVGSLLSSVRDEGCGFEQPLEAIRRALFEHAAPGGPHAGFRRPDAILGILIVSDEDDCSVDDPGFFDPDVGAGAPVGLRCQILADLLGSVESWADRIGELQVDDWSYRTVIGLAAGVPLDSHECSQCDPEGCLADERMQHVEDPTRPGALRPVCNGPGGNAIPARRLVDAASRVGWCDANIVSICAEDWVERLVLDADWPWYSQILPERCLLSGLSVSPEAGSCTLPCDAVEVLSDDRDCPGDPDCPCDASGCRDARTGEPCRPLKLDGGSEPDPETGEPRRRCVWRQATTRPTASGDCSVPLDVGWYYVGPNEPPADDPWWPCAQLWPMPDYNHSYDPPYLEPGSGLRMECVEVHCPR